METRGSSGKQEKTAEKEAAAKRDPRVVEEQTRLGKRIRALREAQRLSQAALAEKAGFSPKYLGEVERGEGNITIELLTKLAGALAVPLAAVMENAHEQPRAALVVEIARMASLLSEKDARIVYRMMKMLIGR